MFNETFEKDLLSGMSFLLSFIGNATFKEHLLYIRNVTEAHKGSAFVIL